MRTPKNLINVFERVHGTSSIDLRVRSRLRAYLLHPRIEITPEPHSRSNICDIDIFTRIVFNVYASSCIVIRFRTLAFPVTPHGDLIGIKRISSLGLETIDRQIRTALGRCTTSTLVYLASIMVDGGHQKTRTSYRLLSLKKMESWK